MSDAVEQAWVHRARAGSAPDFSRLVAAHQSGLRVFLRRLCPNAAEADDIAQESFVFAWGAMGRFDEGRDFRPWLYGIAWRKLRESRRAWARRTRRESALEGGDETDPADPGLQLDLGRALAALGEDERAAALLCLAQGFSHSEAATALEMPLGTVKSHVTRAREKLQAALGERHGSA